LIFPGNWKLIASKHSEILGTWLTQQLNDVTIPCCFDSPELICILRFKSFMRVIQSPNVASSLCIYRKARHQFYCLPSAHPVWSQLGFPHL
uniref:Ovule protein n=1 Tax=Mesocestoides corti TaxID=53468 RepID=A0A5K3FB39_MESCO